MQTPFRLTAVLVIFGFLLPLSVSANVIEDATVSVPDHCTVIDDGGVSHAYPGQFLGICALQAAMNAGLVNGVKFSNAYPALGLFVTTIENVTADPASQYWALYQNGGYASTGLSQLPVLAGDTVVLELHDFSDTFLGDRLTLHIGSLAATPSAPAGPSGGSSLTLHDPFDVPLATGYIWSKQHPDGSFGSPLLDDWVAIASAGGGASDMRTHLSAYEIANQPALSSVTDYERHAMALEALNINPYSGTSIDVIAPIMKAFDGTQMGDPSLVNDDIFALFPLVHAGYTANDDVIAKTTASIVSRQHADGSWDDSTDMTAAAVQAFSLVPSLPGVSDATNKAFGYLHKKQTSDGGFGNTSATAWVMQAIAASEQSESDWNAGTYHTPDYYLATKQERDGGVEPPSADVQTRVWTTAYAIPAIERKTWDNLLSSFTKPLPAATSTPLVATSTSTTATSTAELPVTNTSAPTPAPEPLVKEEAPQIPPPTATTSSPVESAVNQTASVGSASGKLLSSIWNSITFFFSWLF